jgi:hypothetical protein
MDRPQLPCRETQEMRTFRICLDRPQPRTTILGIVRRVAADQGSASASNRQVSTPRPTGIFG